MSRRSQKAPASTQHGTARWPHSPTSPSEQRRADVPRRLASLAGNRAFTALVGQGQPLADEVRLPLEARFGEDFSHVRIHDHAQAHDSARAQGAKAYTHGEDIVFGAQRFDPHQPQGLHLLAHELAHVVQQRRGGSPPSGESQAPTEVAAASAADAVTHGSGPVAVTGASGVGVACEKEDEEEKKVGQASTTVLSQRPKKPGAREQPIDVVNEPKKGKGTAAEVTVPFDRYAGPDWNHIGGGSETASSRPSLARRSSHDVAAGRDEGTAGIDFIVENVRTGRLVIGEQKATQGKQFNDATAITVSLEKNVAHTVEVLKAQLNGGQVHPDAVPGMQRTIARLEATHAALVNRTDLPPGVVFELTNVAGEGQQIGKGHIDLLAEKYGDNPAFLEHLLARTFVRDAALAKSKGRDPQGQRGTDADPDVIPALDLLNDPAKNELDRIKSGKTPAEWDKQQAADKAARDAQQRQADEAAAKTRLKQQKADTAARNAAKKKQVADAGKAAQKSTLKDLRAQRKKSGAPEPTTKTARQKRDSADRGQAAKAAKAARDQVLADQKRAAQQQKAAADAKKKSDADQAAAQRRDAEAQAQARREAYAAELAKAQATLDSMKGKAPEEWDKIPKEERQRLERLATDKDGPPSKELIDAQKRFAENYKGLHTELNAQQTQDFDKHARRQEHEAKARNRRAKNDQNMSKAAHRMNQAAGAVRGIDAFLNARDRGKGVAESLFEGGKTYFDNTNQLMGAVATFQGRMAQEKIPGDPQGRTQQVYGNDAGDAFFGTLGENIAGFVVPGAGWDQLINGGANLIAAGDDHLKRELPADDPKRQQASVRTGTDLVAELTPSRMFSAVVGAGMRAYYDIGRAIRGDGSGVDKFGDDGVRGKLGSVIQPWAMLADFAGNLGGSDATTALNKTLNKGEGSTLSKLGNAMGDGMYQLGQSHDAKAGQYGAPVQGLSMSLGLISDVVGGQSFEQALEKAAKPGEDTLLAKAGGALGDAAYKTVETTKEAIDQGKKVWNEDIPALKEEVKARASEVWHEDLPALKEGVKDRAAQEYHEARDKLTRWWNS